MRVVRLCLLILRLSVAICIALGRARRQDWLGTLAQTLTGSGDKDGAGATGTVLWSYPVGSGASFSVSDK